MRARGLAIAGVVLVLVVAGAIVAQTSSDDATNEAGTSGQAIEPAFDSGGRSAVGESKALAPAAAAQGGDMAVGVTAGGVPAGGVAATIDPAGPRIVRTADIAIEVGKDKFGGAFDRVNAIATSHGGYVTSSSTATTGEDNRARSGQLTLRVPSERFEEVRVALGQLGTPERQSSRGDDVSGQLVDYDARIRSLRAQEDSLRTLVSRANTVGEVLQVQGSLFSVRQQIEQLEAQRLQLDQAASLATIQVSLYEPGAAVVTEPEPQPATSLADSFQRAVDGAISVVGGMVVVIGYLLPLALIGMLGWIGFRLRHRSGRSGGGTATPAPVAP